MKHVVIVLPVNNIPSAVVRCVAECVLKSSRADYAARKVVRRIASVSC